MLVQLMTMSTDLSPCFPNAAMPVVSLCGEGIENLWKLESGDGGKRMCKIEGTIGMAKRTYELTS